jgi:hypothetical protein
MIIEGNILESAKLFPNYFPSMGSLLADFLLQFWSFSPKTNLAALPLGARAALSCHVLSYFTSLDDALNNFFWIATLFSTSRGRFDEPASAVTYWRELVVLSHKLFMCTSVFGFQSLLMKKFLQTHPPITKAIRFFHTLIAQHVSTLNWVLFRCSSQLNCLLISITLQELCPDSSISSFGIHFLSIIVGSKFVRKLIVRKFIVPIGLFTKRTSEFTTIMLAL